MSHRHKFSHSLPLSLRLILTFGVGKVVHAPPLLVRKLHPARADVSNLRLASAIFGLLVEPSALNVDGRRPQGGIALGRRSIRAEGSGTDSSLS